MALFISTFVLLSGKIRLEDIFSLDCVAHLSGFGLVPIYCKVVLSNIEWDHFPSPEMARGSLEQY